MDRWQFSKFGFCDCEMELDSEGDYVLIDDVCEWLENIGHKEVSETLKRDSNL